LEQAETKIDEALADKKKAILAAAQMVFEANGYAHTTMDSVAIKAGTAKGSLYNYFNSKQDLFAQVCRQAFLQDEADVQHIVSEPVPASEKLEKFLDYVFARLPDYTKIGRLILEFWAAAARSERHGNLSVMMQEMHQRGRDVIARIVAEGIESGEFIREIDPMVAAVLINSVIRGIIIQLIFDLSIQVDDDFVSALKRGLLRSLKSPTLPDRTDYLENSK
jgi:TetR/AcrR family fatty acid metabolism transcriptional regulator